MYHLSDECWIERCPETEAEKLQNVDAMQQQTLTPPQHSCHVYFLMTIYIHRHICES